MQISKLSSNQPQYPESLQILDKPPKVLYVRGQLPQQQPMVAIVGTRHLTPYGQQVTYQLARDLAKAGLTIVSGLAIGVDGVAHRAALDAGGRTIAVLAHGLDRVYPVQHRALAHEIIDSGNALVSEYDLGTPPDKFRFPERNRIIAALCDITIVTESAVTGGALITANQAIKAGRTVMAVPGNITSPYSAGPNNLIRSGQGTAITSASDVLATLGYLKREAIPVPAQSPDEAAILNLIGSGHTTSQQLIDQSGLTAAQFANIISLMEITGKVRNLGAGSWAAR